MITLAFRGSADTTKQPQTKLWQETYPESGDDEELIRINHKKSVNSREWPVGRIEDSKNKTSAKASVDRDLPSPYKPVKKDEFQKEDK